MPSRKGHFPGAPGSGERFEHCVHDVRRFYTDKGYRIVSGHAHPRAHEVNPSAVCAAIGRHAHGPGKMQKMAAAGREHPRHNPAPGWRRERFTPGEPVVFAPAYQPGVDEPLSARHVALIQERLALYTVAPRVGEKGSIADAPQNGVVWVDFPSTGTISVAPADLWREWWRGSS